MPKELSKFILILKGSNLMLLNYLDPKTKNDDFIIENVPFDMDDFESTEDNLTAVARVALPNTGENLSKYNVVIVWDDEDRGIVVPSTVQIKNGDSVAEISLSIRQGTSGIAELVFSLSEEVDFSDFLVGEIMNYIKQVTFIADNNHDYDIGQIAVASNLKEFFYQADLEKDGMNVSVKDKNILLSFENEYGCLKCEKFKYYTIMPNDASGVGDDVLFDGTYYFTKSSPYKLKEIFNGDRIQLTGYSSLEEIKALEASVLAQVASNNSAALNNGITDSAETNFYLDNGLIYPVSSALPLKSNLYIQGNNATLYACKPDGEMSIISNHPQAQEVNNIRLENLTLLGRYYSTGIKDQGIMVKSNWPAIKNLLLDNVKIKGFYYDVHLTRDLSQSELQLGVASVGDWNWRFNNCEFTESGFPLHLKFFKGLKVTNCYLDARFSSDKTQHCIYMCGGCEDITVDNCLLENAVGSGVQLRVPATNTAQIYYHNNITLTNLTIKNCGIGLNINAFSKNVTIKNVTASNVVRGLELRSCKDVIIDNLNIFNAFSKTYFTNDGVSIRRFNGYVEDDWVAIRIIGSVQAKIENSYFKTCGHLIRCSSYDYGDSTKNEVKEHNLVKANFPEFQNDILTHYLVTIDFNNCKFDSSCNTDINFLGLNCDGDPEDTSIVQKYIYNMSFTGCELYFLNDKSAGARFRTRGDTSEEGAIRSEFKFDKCLLAYYFKVENARMPKRYLFEPLSGAFLEIKDCSVYQNLPNDSSEPQKTYIDLNVAETGVFASNPGTSSYYFNGTKIYPEDTE